MTELQDKTYEYYEFQLSGNSLKKWIKNTEATAQVGKGIEKIIIVDAEDLSGVDFACWNTIDGDIGDIDAVYNANDKTLTISAKTGNIPTFNFRDIYFGDSSKDINMCHPETNSYKFKGAAPDLTKSHATAILTNLGQSPSIPDLTLDLSILNTGAVTVQWYYSLNPSGWKKAFRVPSHIIPEVTSNDYSTT